MKAEKMQKKGALTDFNAPNGSRDISFQESGIWERWKLPFWKFWASFSHKYDVTDVILQDSEKVKVRYLRSLLFDLFEILQAVRIWQKNFAWFQILLLWQPKSTQSSIIEKQKAYYLSKSVF